MNFSSFSIARLPRIEFGNKTLNKVPGLIAQYGTRLLLVTGKQAIINTPQWHDLVQGLQNKGIEWTRVQVNQEPSPQLVDDTVREMLHKDIQVVVGLGGGSVLDAAKAIAGLLPHGNSVMDHLEGVGPELPYKGPALPFIAIPTTAGTGSEATKNAVLSMQGRDGFKKSFRHDQLVPEYAILDPELLKSCPPELIAANGMDALTQLMESFVSLKSNPFTDALAISGVRAVRDSLLAWYHKPDDAEQARNHMAYASLLSGICLAQTGLGSVHGLASPLGAFFPIPHGVVCGTLVADATRINIEAMLAREPGNPALEKYSRLGTILCNRKYREPLEAQNALISLLEDWTVQLRLQRLSHYGVTREDFEHITANSRGSSMKTNPIVLSDGEIMQLLDARL